jgi:DNA-binding transcriptional MocR family regulator
VSIETDAHGLIPDGLEAALARHRPKFLYLIPTFQNPTGRTLPLERRLRLVELCQEHDVLLLADEVYHLLSYGDAPPAPFAAHGGSAKVISLGSFSKILAPGLRLGWVQAHPSLISRLAGCGLLDSGGGLNPFTSAMVRGVIEGGGLEENVARLVSIYRSKRDAMAAGLDEHLPGAAYALPGGGYFFWVRLPGGMDASALQQNAEGLRVNFRPGIRFSSRGSQRDYVRLCFIFYGSEEIEEGLRRLAQTITLCGHDASR